MKVKQCKICNKDFEQNSNCQKYCKGCAKQKGIDVATKNNKRYPGRFAACMRKVHYWRKYKITVAVYDRLLAKQGGGCAICGRKDNNNSAKYLDVDENPISHLPRGLVCNACNRSIGKHENMWLKDRKLIKKIEIYLAKYDVGYYNLL